MDLIKKLNDDANEAELLETTGDASVFKILDITKIRGVNDILEAGEGKCGEGKCGSKPKAENEEGGFSKQQIADMKKLVSQYKDRKPDDQDVKLLIGDDLEMLEYSPEEIEQMVPAIQKMMKEVK